MVKTIWLVNTCAMPPHLEPRLQTIKLAQYLGEKGYDVKIFASSVMHNMDMNIIEDGSPYVEKSYGNVHFVHINTLQYGKSRVKRIFSVLQFRHKVANLAHKFPKPDVIIHVPGFLMGYKIANLGKKLKAKYITQVLDLYPESIVELGVLGRKNPIIKALRWYEKRMYIKADEHVFSQEGGKDYIINQGWDKAHGGPIDLSTVHYINNGVDLKDFEFNKEHYTIEDADLLDTSVKKVMYLGSIRLANNVMQLIKAAEVLKERKDIKFLIYGNGDERPVLESYCKEHSLNNVLFKDKWVEPKYVPYIVSQADVHVLNYMPGGFGHYGGSQSKSFQYMASGKPICCNIRMAYCPITKYNIGIADEFQNAEEYAQAILSVVDMPKNEYEAMCLRAKEAAKHYDYEYLTSKMIEILE